MVMLDLQVDEADTLLGILQDDLSDLRMEIVDTEGYEYQLTLRHQRAVLKNIIAKLGVAIESQRVRAA